MSDRDEIEAFTQQFDPCSDFCFSLLTFYNCGGHTRWCWLNGNLVLRFSDSFGPGIFLTFLGNKNETATAASLIKYAMKMDFTPTLCPAAYCTTWHYWGRALAAQNSTTKKMSATPGYAGSR